MSNRKQSGQKGDADAKAAADAAAKRPYQKPRLAVYGSLRHLALGVDGKKSDGGGSPKSRA